MPPARRSPEALLAEGDRLIGQKRFAEAVVAFRRVTALAPNNAFFLARLGDALTLADEPGEAITVYRRAISLAPKAGSLHRNLANAAFITGDLESGRNAMRTAIGLIEDNAALHRQLSASSPHQPGDPDIAAMEEALKRPLTDAQRMHLGFGLGKAYDDIGEYDRAMDEFLLANRLRRTTFNYSSQQDDDRFARITETFSASYIAANRGKGHPTSKPIFILGMPRSGTTLLEQVLANVPGLYAAGELEAMRRSAQKITGTDVQTKPEAIAGRPVDFEAIGRTYLSLLPRASVGSRYVEDKLPQNFLLAGLIHLALPNARIIHLTRDPADNCLSIFKVFFATEGHPYAYDLTELAHYHNLYRALMRHWHAVMPGVIHDVSYEALTADPETVTRRLFDDLGFDWSPAMLDTASTKREVKTASLLQVRQPIHTRSVNSATRYGERLKPLLEELAKAP